ncbi:putative uncharacterized iron-regulated membrane protein [Bradyrhizobium sp. STM 3843]|uniref:PepSY-associated TM helix domain-containing protein n=1 Tax=Bradyrhizobium sp. STM 3843 TaxID=551947 RepID=UPI0002404620|nr:PepSY-associated TM helix domain-containing protein [Bradyrhizobium sp. STM 3843]CCE07987.1 putative uncharacterized iron-regulated membrane protein [Bradyrhizobium sp. STM 3843]
MARARTIRLWSSVHTWTSLASMLFLLMLCITGLPLIFHDEIDDWLEREIAAPDMPADTPRVSLDRAIAAAQARFPGQYVLFASLQQSEPLVTVALSPTPVPAPGAFHRVTIDARTAAVLGEEAPHLDVMDIVLRIHKDMFAGLPGELFLGVIGLVLVLSLISGVVLYGPFMRKLAFGTVRGHASPRLRWLDTHNLLGILTVTWMLAVGLTGTINTLATPLFDLWRAQLLPSLLAPYQGRPVAKAASVEAAVTAVRTRFPDRLISSVTLPTAARFGSPQHLIVWTKGRTPFSARMLRPVLVEAEDAERIVSPEVPWYLQGLQVSRPLHFGDYGGWPLKIIWALLDLIAIIVLGSGVYLWAARRRVARRNPSLAVDAGEAAPS